MNFNINEIFIEISSKIQEILTYDYGIWEVIGFLGIVAFGSRFIVQWIVSEIRKESVIPVSFWYLSLIGSLLQLSYAIHIANPIFILSYLPNSLIYMRNLYFIYKKRELDNLNE